MRTNYSIKSILIMFFILTLIACEKEPFSNPPDTTDDFETFSVIDNISSHNEGTKSSVDCVLENSAIIGTGYAGVITNGGKYKTLDVTVIQNFNSILIEAFYAVDINNDNLPAIIDITFNGETVSFDKVSPNETVSHRFEIPENKNAGLSYSVDQKVYLEPVSVESNIDLLPICDINLNDSLFGGTVVYIFQEGEEGYVEGETHGIIFKATNNVSVIWDTAMDMANNYSNEVLNNWTLPTIDMVNKANYTTFGSYWTSTEYSDNQAYVFQGFAGSLNVFRDLKISEHGVAYATEF